MISVARGDMVRRQMAYTESTELPLERILARMGRTATRETKCWAVAAACGEHVEGGPLYTPENVAEWWARAEELGCTGLYIGPRIVTRLYERDLIPNAKFRARALELVESGMSWRALEKEAGYSSFCFEGAYVRRLVGDVPTPRERGKKPALKTWVQYKDATRLCGALGIDYLEVGI